MDKENYLEKLETLLIENKYDKEYIEVCKNYAEQLLSNDLPVIFDVLHLSKLIGTTVEFIHTLVFAQNLYYREAHIPKKNGDVRILNIPALELKYIQRWILDNILSKLKVSEFATGFCNNRSIVDNARYHINKDCVINIDVKDFFPRYPSSEYLGFLLITDTQRKFPIFLLNFAHMKMNCRKVHQQVLYYLILLI